MWRIFVVKGHEAVVSFVNDAVKTCVEGDNDYNNEPAGNEVY